MRCEWCGASFPAQELGRFAKRFCGNACRGALHQAARRWGLAAYDAGMVTAETLRNAPAAQRDRRATTATMPKRGRKPRTKATPTRTED